MSQANSHRRACGTHGVPAVRLVSRTFRTLLLDTYPALRDDPAFLRFAEYLLFSATSDRCSGQPVIPQAVLARCEGKEHQLAGRNYCGKRFLDRFSQEVTPVAYSGWRYQDGRARTVIGTVFSPAISIARDAELRSHGVGGGLVDLVTGMAYNRAAQSRHRAELRAEAKRLAAEAQRPATRQLLTYMNSLPSNGFTKLPEYVEAARAIADRLPCASVRHRQLSLLNAIRVQPMPFYRPAAHSARIFALNPSIAHLKRELRAVLTQGWVQFDLSSAQLAICARQWDVPEVATLLASGASIWCELEDYFRQQGRVVAKETLKRALYALLFGAGRHRIGKIFREATHPQSDATVFLDHPLLRVLWHARQQRLAAIRQAGGARDSLGTWIPNEGNARSVLAQLAQATELQLLLPVVTLAEKEKEFTIRLWLHDGFYVTFRDRDKQDLWSRHIDSAVNEQAARLGIRTHLVRTGAERPVRRRRTR
jgi:hypothetical protein